jgi:xanthine dehydrogenase YagS FAD-binding subunit
VKSFSIQYPTTVEEAARLLPHEDGARGAMLLAGGQDLLTELAEHLAEPERLVSLRKVGGLDRVEVDASGALTVGALVTLETIAEHADVRARWPALAEAAQSVGSPQIRAMGTLGGNLNQRPRCWYYRNELTPCLKKGGSECFAYAGRNRYNAILGGGPSYIVHPSDLAPALVALDAEVELVGPAGARRVPLESYYTLPAEADVTRETVRASDEVLTRVLVPAPAAGARSTYLKFQERASFDFALAAVALWLVLDGGKVAVARVVLGGVAPKPWRSAEAEAALRGRAPDAEAARAAGEAALAPARALAENGYKIPLTKALLTRALERLAT